MPLQSTVPRALGIVLAGACACFPGCGKATGQAAAAVVIAVPVELRGVHRADVQRSVAVTGTLTGQEEAVVSARVAGPVAVVLRDLGDRVAPGDELARLDPSDYRLAETRAGAAVQESLARLGLVRLPDGDLDVEELPGVARARLQVENATHRFKRFQPLAGGGNDLISAQDLEDLGNRVELAKRDLQAERIASQALLAQARTAKAELDVAAKRLADTSVRVPDLGLGAPAAGADAAPPYTVAARLVAPGEWVKEGTNLYRVVADRVLKLKADVPERFAGDLARGQLVTIELAGAAAPVTGRVERISPRVDPLARTVPVEVLVPNAAGALRAGAFARGAIRTRVDSVLLAPADAVVAFAGVTKVFTVVGGVARELPVEVGSRVGDEVEVRAGLAGGERLVVSGTSRLAGGVAVTVRAPAAPAPLAPLAAAGAGAPKS